MTDVRQAIHDRLQEMAGENRLSARAVVDEAQAESSVLHPYFEWDDSKAADHHRLDQARRMISSFVITVVRNEQRYRVQEFVEDVRKPENTQGYIQLESLIDDQQAARNFVERAMRLAENSVATCTDFAAVLGLSEKVEGLIEDIKDLRNEIREPQQPAA